ncbi:MAG: hypothetical protein WC219_07040 [Acholeplasmataceae bacterium]
MKKIIVILAVILSAMMFTLEVSKMHANSIELKTIEFIAPNNEVVYKDYYEVGSDLSELNIPDAPKKDGYIFVGWSIDAPEVMPDHHVKIYAQYMQSQVVVYEKIG